MAFNRHAILKAHYAQRIASEWKWDKIVAEAKQNVEPSEEGDGNIGRCYLGSILRIAPSGKYYAPWTTNQTSADETRDAAYMEALEEAAEKAGGYITGSEGDGCDVVFEMSIDDEGGDNAAD